jgi:hypothetical protein
MEQSKIKISLSGGGVAKPKRVDVLLVVLPGINSGK